MGTIALPIQEWLYWFIVSFANVKEKKNNLGIAPPQQEERASSGGKSVRRETYNLLPLFISETRLHAYKRCWAAAPPNFDPTHKQLFAKSHYFERKETSIYVAYNSLSFYYHFIDAIYAESIVSISDFCPYTIIASSLLG